MESIQKFRPNIVNFQLEKWERRCYIIRCYLYPNNSLAIESIIAVLKERPQGLEILVAGYFNADLVQTEKATRKDEIVTALKATLLEDILAHLLLQQRPWCWDDRTWSMVRLGREFRSWTD